MRMLTVHGSSHLCVMGCRLHAHWAAACESAPPLPPMPLRHLLAADCVPLRGMEMLKLKPNQS